ncbi:unnamed protein product, partial [Acanthocheilonema viteae]
QLYESHKLSGPQRKIILNEDNKLRSRLAFGTIKNKNGIYMPTAKNMLEMIWSENLEKCGFSLEIPDEGCVTTKNAVGLNIFGYISRGDDNLESNAMSSSMIKS